MSDHASAEKYLEFNELINLFARFLVATRSKAGSIEHLEETMKNNNSGLFLLYLKLQGILVCENCLSRRNQLMYWNSSSGRQL